MRGRSRVDWLGTDEDGLVGSYLRCVIMVIISNRNQNNSTVVLLAAPPVPTMFA